MANIRTLRVPCLDDEAAEKCAGMLEDNGLDVTGTDGRFVLVPAGWSPGFVWSLAEAVSDYCIDAELARWASDAAEAGIHV